MKQLIHQLHGGKAVVMDVPAKGVDEGFLLIQNVVSLISAGTERMVVNAASKGLIGKALTRPDMVRQVIEKAQRDGLITTFKSVKQRLGSNLSLGYSSAGIVIDVGKNCSGFQIGDRVACAGGGYAVHAEVVAVPKNLVVKIGDQVDFESAAVTTLGAIALQGVRLAEVKLGEVVVVIGLGLLGLLAVQILKASGCTVLGMEIQAERAQFARELCAIEVAVSPDELIALCGQLSGGHGADAILITADTKSDQPVELAGKIARNKGIVVAVGAVGTTIPRNVYYEKELDFRISRSYGPGRYDTDYEEKGVDYPIGYVRWTENRNMQAFVQLLENGSVNAKSLITHRFPIEEAPKAYDTITGKTEESFLGVLITYSKDLEILRRIDLRQKAHVSVGTKPASYSQSSVQLGILGAGDFANATLLPAIKKLDSVEMVGIASAGGLSARSAADRFGFAYCSTDNDEILSDPDISTIAILTRHHLHFPHVMAALTARKHVFVEKPLCLTQEELDEIVSTYSAMDTARNEELTSQGGNNRHSEMPFIMVGFNRRFAPYVVELKKHLDSVKEPLILHYRINAGHIPPSHWTQDPRQGGGRLLGEACHFIDLLIYLAGAVPVQVTTHSLPDSGRYSRDNFMITLELADGSLAIVTYLANGDKDFGKEYLEVFGGGLSASIDNYKKLLIRHGPKRVKKVNRMSQDKGHQREWQALIAYLTGKGPKPMTFEEIVNTTRATLAAQRSLELGGKPVVF